MSAPAGAGFTLGTAWRMSYGGQVVPVDADNVYVVEDDGTTNAFTKQDSVWVPGAGVFDTLTYSAATGWRLARKDQSYRRFDAGSGRLIEEVDPLGNAVTVAYDTNNRINTITDAVGRALTFIYDSNGRLSELRDPTTPTPRKWTFAYDTTNRLSTLTDPANASYGFSYTTNGRLATLTDRNGKTFTITGGTGDFTIADPSPFTTEQRFVDHFVWQLQGEELTLIDRYATHTDRRGNVWIFKFFDLHVPAQLKTLINPLGHSEGFTYDSGNNRTTYTNQRGKTWSYTYDSKGNRLTETDPFGSTITYEYHATFNRVTTRTEPDTQSPSRRVTTWLYDHTTGALIATQDALQNITYFDYDANGMLTRRTTPDGTITEYSYDAYGQPAGISVDPGQSPRLNLVTSTALDIVGRPVSRTDARGTVTSFTTDALGRVTKQVVDSADGGLQLTSSFTYDANGNRLTETNPRGVVSKHEYDALNRLTRTVRGFGLTGFAFETTYDYDANGNLLSTTDAENKSTGYAYDDANRRTTVTDAAGGVTETTLDPAANAITIENHRNVITSQYFDDLNRMTQSIVDPAGLALTTSYQYGLPGGGGCGCGGSAGFGQLNKLTDPAGKVTYYYYDLMNRRIKEVRKAGDTADNGGDSDDAITETTHDSMGRVVTVRQVNDPDPDEVVQTAYDSAGRVISRVMDPGGLNLVTQMTYDANGNVVTETSPTGHVTTYSYDRANRRTGVSDSIGAVESREYDANGNLRTLKTADNRQTTYAYDALDRLTVITDRDGRETSFTYDNTGRERTRTDRIGRTRTTEYDDVYRRTKVVDALNNETRFEYDAVGNLTKLTAVNGTELQDTTYTYDNANRRTKERYPLGDGDERTYTYTPAGRLASRTDQNGDMTTYTYDDLHRLIGRTYARSETSPSYPTTQGPDTFTYDRVGRMKSAEHVQGADTFTLEFAHDAAGRTTGVDQGGHAVSHAYAASEGAHFVETGYPEGLKVRHQLDGRGRVSGIREYTGGTPGAYFAQQEFDLDNRLTVREFGNGTSANWTHDVEDRVSLVSHHCPSCGSGGSAWDFVRLAYGRDAEGNPIYREHVHAPATSEWYAYDEADRLVHFQRGTLDAQTKQVSGTPAEAQRWELDALGNWKTFEQDESGTKVVEQARTHRVDNALTAINATSLAYDAAGNLKDDGAWLYDYDCENRLTRVRRKSDSAVVGEYGYNALGWRVKKVVSNSAGLNGAFHMHYNAAWQLVQVRPVSMGDEPSRLFVHAGPARAALPGRESSAYVDDHVAMLTSLNGARTRYYYHADALFNTLAMTDAGGAIVERVQYAPYGAAVLRDGGGNALATSSVGNPLLRQGILRDWETGHDDNRHRWYSPTLGRWGQRDPLGTADVRKASFGPPTARHGASGRATTVEFELHRCLKYRIEEPAAVEQVAGSPPWAQVFASELSNPWRAFRGDPYDWIDPSGLFCVRGTPRRILSSPSCTCSDGSTAIRYCKQCDVCINCPPVVWRTYHTECGPCGDPPPPLPNLFCPGPPPVMPPACCSVMTNPNVECVNVQDCCEWFFTMPIGGWLWGFFWGMFPTGGLNFPVDTTTCARILSQGRCL